MQIKIYIACINIKYSITNREKETKQIKGKGENLFYFEKRILIIKSKLTKIIKNLFSPKKKKSLYIPYHLYKQQTTFLYQKLYLFDGIADTCP